MSLGDGIILWASWFGVVPSVGSWTPTSATYSFFCGRNTIKHLRLTVFPPRSQPLVSSVATLCNAPFARAYCAWRFGLKDLSAQHSAVRVDDGSRAFQRTYLGSKLQMIIRTLLERAERLCSRIGISGEASLVIKEPQLAAVPAHDNLPAVNCPSARATSFRARHSDWSRELPIGFGAPRVGATVGRHVPVELDADSRAHPLLCRVRTLQLSALATSRKVVSAD